MNTIRKIQSESSGNGRNASPVFITGGAGFIGANLAHRILGSGRSAIIYDNLSRPGVEQNLRWLKAEHGNLLQVTVADTRDAQALRAAIQNAGQVFHFAAQVAVTTSLTNPMDDFMVNACGTMNILEALRSLTDPPPFIYTSTNKVYGALPDLSVVRNGAHYEPSDPEIREHGVGENRPLDFHSPYGCSKGAADQYVLDYARTFSIPTAVFRMSCIYGPHQFGNEDQGWVAHFILRTGEEKPITIYGDGRQVRDVLFVEDLVDAFLLAQRHITRISGNAFNIGGGPSNTLSLLELLDLIHSLDGSKPSVRFDNWRIGDQRYYVSDIRKFQEATGWAPRTGVREGVEKLHRWLRERNVSFSPGLTRYRGSEGYEILAH